MYTDNAPPQQTNTEDSSDLERYLHHLKASLYPEEIYLIALYPTAPNANGGTQHKCGYACILGFKPPEHREVLAFEAEMARTEASVLREGLQLEQAPAGWQVRTIYTISYNERCDLIFLVL